MIEECNLGGRAQANTVNSVTGPGAGNCVYSRPGVKWAGVVLAICSVLSCSARKQKAHVYKHNTTILVAGVMDAYLRDGAGACDSSTTLGRRADIKGCYRFGNTTEEAARNSTTGFEFVLQPRWPLELYWMDADSGHVEISIKIDDDNGHCSSIVSGDFGGTHKWVGWRIDPKPAGPDSCTIDVRPFSGSP